MNKTESVREYFREMGTSTAAAAAKALGLTQRVAYARVRDLYDKGWLQKVPGCLGMYEYHQLEEHEYGRSAALREKLWRSIKIAKSFTAWDIAMYAGTTLDYAKKYIYSLVKRGYVEKYGRKGQKAVYRITAAAPRSTPKLRKSAGQRALQAKDLENMGWELLRALKKSDMDEAKKIYAAMGAAFTEIVS